MLACLKPDARTAALVIERGSKWIPLSDREGGAGRGAPCEGPSVWSLLLALGLYQ